jgi:hypothetical protein
MTYVNSVRVAGILGLAATLLMAGAVVTEAQAGNGGRQKAHAGQGAGGSWSRSSTLQRTPSGHTRQDQWQGQHGRSASRHVAVSNDPASGTRNRTAVRTGPEGRSTTVDTVTQRTGSGYTREVTRTLPDGQVNQRSIDVSCDPTAQSCTKTVTGGDRGD